MIEISKAELVVLLLLAFASGAILSFCVFLAIKLKGISRKLKDLANKTGGNR